MEPPSLALASPNRGTISEADMLACLNSPPGSALVDNAKTGSASKLPPPRIATNSLTTGSPVGSGRGLGHSALGSPINLQTPGAATSLTSPQEDLELELSLRGRLIVDQQRRIVELESELAHAQAEITRLKEKVEEFKNANKEKEEKKPQSRYWTPEEHDRFLDGLEKFGAKDVKSISAYVGSRNATQVRTHAQKYYLRLMREQKAEKEGSGGVKRQAVYMRSPNKSKKMKRDHNGGGNGSGGLSTSSDDKKVSNSDRPGATEKKWQPSEYVLLEKGLKEFANEPDMIKTYNRIAEIFLPKRTPEEVAELHAYYTTKVQRDPGDSVHNMAASGTINQRTRRANRKPPPGLKSDVPPNTPGFGNTSPTQLLAPNLPTSPGSPGQQAPLLTVPLSPTGGTGPLTPLASPGDPLSPSFLDSFSNGGNAAAIAALGNPGGAADQVAQVAELASPGRTRRSKDKPVESEVAKPLDFGDGATSMRRSSRRSGGKS